VTLRLRLLYQKKGKKMSSGREENEDTPAAKRACPLPDSSEHWLLVLYEEDFGRMGDLRGMFFVTPEQLEYLKERCTVEFGEVLGKHSDITGLMNEYTLSIVTEDQKWIQQTFDVLHLRGKEYKDLGGINPYKDLKEMEKDWPPGEDTEEEEELEEDEEEDEEEEAIVEKKKEVIVIDD
jgi:hypothetical protein